MSRALHLALIHFPLHWRMEIEHILLCAWTFTARFSWTICQWKKWKDGFYHVFRLWNIAPQCNFQYQNLVLFIFFNSGIAQSICGFLLSHLSVFVMTCRHLLIFSFISCILIKLIKLTKAVSYMHVSILTYIYFCIMYKLTAIRIIPNCPNYS